MMFILKSCLLLCLLSNIGAHQFRCDYSYSDIGWVKLHRVPATFRDARLRCRYEDAVLASPLSAELLSTMVNLTEGRDIFTGIHALSSGTFRSIEGMSLENHFHSWADGEPNNVNNAERCISLNSEGNLSDVSCDIPRPYICYRALVLNVGINACGTTDPEYRFEKRTNKCYKFHTTPRTFERADLVCDAEGGHLAIINSDTESKVIFDIFSRHSAKSIIGTSRTDIAFIGFLKWDSEWVTIQGQTLKKAGFDRFFLGEPNNSTTGEYCGSVYRNGYLNDLWCDQEFTFICEKKADYPSICDSKDFLQSNIDY